jgi:glycosyltransferase involved in cell wall biosynthesis
MKLAILIPAYNEEKTIGQVLTSIPRRFPKVNQVEIVVISDGSTDKTVEIAQKAGVTLIEHNLNRGLGGALGTGFEYVRQNYFDVVVTFDADGQHQSEDIWPVIRPIIYRRADVVIGSRLKSASWRTRGMPWYRLLGIWGLNLVTLIFFWVWSTDSQSGLRAFSKKAIRLIDIQANKMEVSSEFFYEIGRHELKFKEVPIRSIYTEYSLAKGQKNWNIFRIISRLIYRRFFSK